jgi:hypothetical protein
VVLVGVGEEGADRPGWRHAAWPPAVARDIKTRAG